MIVNVAAWYYIVSAALSFIAFLMQPAGFNRFGGGDLLYLAFIALFAGMGVALLQRKTWGRFLALGSSLFGWTLGSLFLIVLLGAFVMFAELKAFFALAAFGGSGFMFMAVLCLLLWVVGIVITFKLFWYLCSQEGCEEFGVPYGSAGTVLASCGIWIAIALVNIAMSDSGQLMYAVAAESAARSSQQEHLDREQDALRRDSEERNAALRAEIEARRRAEAEAEAAQGYDEAAEVDAAEVEESAAVEESQVVEEEVQAQWPATQPATETEKEEEPAKNRILKCRDSAGGITFTQGYCPPGSTKVDMPGAE